MLEKFRTLLGHTLIYGLGNYGVRLIGFLLIPVYTRYLTTTDYGVLALVSIFTQALWVFVSLGQSPSLFRFYYEGDTAEDRERVVASALWIVLLFSLPIALIPLLAPRVVAGLALGDPALWFLIVLGTGTVVFKTLLRMPFQMMRAEDESKRYATWSILRNGATTLLSLVLVTGLAMGVTGVVLGQFLGELLLCFCLLGMSLPALRAGIHWTRIKDQLRYGLPMVPAGVAALTVDMIDRWFLEYYATTSDVGIYSLGYRFGEIIAFLVAAFQLSWPQFIFRNQREPDAPQIYAHMANYYFAVLLLVWLCLATFSHEVIRVMATPAFHPAAAIVPIVALGMVFDGSIQMVKIGILLSKSLARRTVAVFGAAGVNVVLNFLLVPRYGMMGAAWATAGSFLTQLALMFFFAQRLYPVPFQYGRIAGVFVSALALFGLSTLVVQESIVLSVLLKLGLVAMFPVAVVAFGLVTRSDLAEALAWVRARRAG